MPPRDTVRGAVRTALERDGWVITADPLVLPVGLHNHYVDLAAERVVAALSLVVVVFDPVRAEVWRWFR